MPYQPEAARWVGGYSQPSEDKNIWSAVQIES